MGILDNIKNAFLYSNKYKTNSEAVIVACYFNPLNNPYRLKAFKIWYDSIKHLNHYIVECLIGETKADLTDIVPIANCVTVKTNNLLWHKETLLNNIISTLPRKYKYVFWLDTDVLFTNKNWLVDSVIQLKTKNIVQPFEYCIHLDQDQIEPHFDVTHEYEFVSDPKHRHPKMWRSFCANYVTTNISGDSNYDKHGHVGFAWGARREVLDSVPLYDRALIGGADHIIAHAAAGQLMHSCITKSFTENLDEIDKWSKKFYSVVRGKIGYVKGDLHHIWHGDINKRQYLKRIQEFTPAVKNITSKDKNGLHVTNNKKDDKYIKDYFEQREAKDSDIIISISKSNNNQYKIPVIKNTLNKKRIELKKEYPYADDSFIESLIVGYATDSTLMGSVIGGNVMGAMIGDMLNDKDSDKTTSFDNANSENFS